MTTLTVAIDKSISIDDRTFAVAGEMGVALTVNVDASLQSLGNGKLTYLDFLQPDGTAYYKGDYDCSSGTFGVTLGATDTVLAYAGDLWIQLVIRDAVPPDGVVVWKSNMLKVVVGNSVGATVPASIAIVPPLTMPATYPAETVTVADAGDLITATNVEDALQEIATNIDTIETNVGTLLYTENNYITDSEPLTTSVNKLDVALKDRADEILVIQATKFKNYIINGGFQVNQRVVSGTVTLSAGVYGHDRWKAGASGCTYTFATSGGVTTITISAGSLVQVVEGISLATDNYALSWTGTAQGKIGSGSFSASGVTGSVTGGSNLSIEFNTGTLSNVMLCRGSIAITYINEVYADVLAQCQRYYYRVTAELAYGFFGTGKAFNADTLNIIVPFHVTMQATPTLETSAMNTFYYETGGTAGNTPTSIVVNASSGGKNAGAINVAKTGAFTTGSYYWLVANNTTSAYIGFIAEL